MNRSTKSILKPSIYFQFFSGRNQIFSTVFPAIKYRASIRNISDYSPFGVELQGRTVSSDEYRYGFNGMEKDDEISGPGNSYDFGARMYSNRVGKFLSLDRFTKNTPNKSPYTFASNTPIIAVDKNGDSTYVVLYGKGYLNVYYKGHDQKDAFKKQAEARKKEIEGRPTFDPTRDEVIVMETPSSQQAIAVINTKYSTGKIVELHVYSHGSMGSVSLGGRKEGDINPDGSIVTLQEETIDWGDSDGDGVHDTYDNRELNSTTITNLDKTNFESDARMTLWGCNMGGLDLGNSRVRSTNPGIEITYTQQQIIEASIGNALATYLLIEVAAFTGSSEAKTVNKDGNSPLNIDGEMIRTKDRASQAVKQTIFKAGGGVKSSPEIKP